MARDIFTLKTHELGTRRAVRGAVFVEAVLVVSMLTLMLAGGAFLHRVYVAKVDTIREARTTAWSAALAGCQNAIGNIEATEILGGSSDIGGEVQHREFTAERLAATEQNLRSSAGGENRSPWPLQYEYRTTTTVACNEVEGEAADVLYDRAGPLLTDAFGSVLTFSFF